MKDRAYEIAINPKYDGYQRGLASMVYKFFDKKTELRVSLNEELAKELDKPLIKKNFLKKEKSHPRFKNNVWAPNLAEIGSLSSKHCGVKYLLFVIGVFTKYAWFKPLKVEKAKTVLSGIIKIVRESICEPNKL